MMTLWQLTGNGMLSAGKDKSTFIGWRFMARPPGKEDSRLSLVMNYKLVALRTGNDKRL